MYMKKSSRNPFIYLDIMSIVMLLLSLSSLIIIAFEGIVAPIFLFIVMFIFGLLLIILFSKDELLIKLKLFLFFFSSFLLYALVNHYILINLYPNLPPFQFGVFSDESVYYHFSNLAMPYISGEKIFIDIFNVFEIHESVLHTIFSASIAYFSTIIDGENTIIVQKILSPFLGGILSVILYATLKYQFTDRIFALKSTIVYVLFSAVFIYSTAIMRDIDIALLYMMFIYLFIQKNNFINFILLLLVAFSTIYIRVESGMVLFALILLYSHLYVRNVQNKSIKFIFYIFVGILFSIIILGMYGRIIEMIIHINDANTTRGIAQSSSGSISLLFNKLPFPLSAIVKVLFGQMQPFPFFLLIERPPEAISGIFWPFIFLMMIYAIIKKTIRIHIDVKVKYLLIVAIGILFLMSSEPVARRMMSVYPIIYIVSLYTFYILPNYVIKRLFYYYFFIIVVLNTVYYFIKT